MGKLIIKRRSDFCNQLANYQLLLDGNKIGSVSYGQSKEFNITPGQHILKANFEYSKIYSSPEVLLTFNENEQKELIVSGFKYSNYIVPVVAICIFFSFLFPDIKTKLLFYIPFFIMAVYNLTIGRKRYLTFKEIR